MQRRKRSGAVWTKQDDVRFAELQEKGEAITNEEEEEARRLFERHSAYLYQTDPEFKKRMDIWDVAQQAIDNLTIKKLIDSREDAAYIASTFFNIGLMVGRSQEEKQKVYFGKRHDQTRSPHGN